MCLGYRGVRTDSTTFKLRRNLDTTSQAYTTFKTATRQGTFADLNIFVTSMQSAILGYAILRMPAVCIPCSAMSIG